MSRSFAETNVNSKTGIRYGIVDAKDFPYLYDDIIDNGTNLDYQYYQKEMISEIETFLEEKDYEGLSAFIEEHTSQWDKDDNEEKAKDFIDNESNADSVFDDLMLNEEYMGEEDNYEYTDNEGNEFYLSYLGGAPLIWVFFSNKIVYAKSLCSPCVPNGADLNSGLTDKDNGYECYGIPDCYSENESES